LAAQEVVQCHVPGACAGALSLVYIKSSAILQTILTRTEIETTSKVNALELHAR